MACAAQSRESDLSSGPSAWKASADRLFALIDGIRLTTSDKGNCLLECASVGFQQIDRARKALAVGQSIEGLTVFGGGHGGEFKGQRAKGKVQKGRRPSQGEDARLEDARLKAWELG